MPRGNLFSDISTSWLGLPERLSLRGLECPDRGVAGQRGHGAERIGSKRFDAIPPEITLSPSFSRSPFFLSKVEAKPNVCSPNRVAGSEPRPTTARASQKPAGRPIRARTKQKKGEKTYRPVRSSLHPVSLSEEPTDESSRPCNYY